MHLEDLSPMNPTLHQLGIDRLSVSERIELIGLTWNSIVASDEILPIPEWHQHELEKRRAAAADPQAGIPWEDGKARLMDRP
jgi:putative addiction module component (TIGR02574 family)